MHFVVVDDAARRQERELESVERVSIKSAVAGRELHGPVGPPREVLPVISVRVKELGHRLALLQEDIVLRVEHFRLNVAGCVFGELDVARRFVGVSGAHHVEHSRAGFPCRHLAAAIRRLGGFPCDAIRNEPVRVAVPVRERLDDRSRPGSAVLGEPGPVRYEFDFFRVHEWALPLHRR